MLPQGNIKLIQKINGSINNSHVPAALAANLVTSIDNMNMGLYTLGNSTNTPGGGY